MPEDSGFDEGIDRPNHDLVQWDQYPTYQDGTVNFKGTLLNDAVFSHPGSTPRQGTEVYPNFRGWLASDRLYLGSVLPQGSTLPLTGYRLYPFDVIADSYHVDGQSFAVSFTFPEGLEGAQSDYVITVYGFQDEARVPIIDTYRDSGAFVDLLGYARIRVLAPSPTATATETATPVPVVTLASLHETQNTRWLVRNHPSLARQIHALSWVEDGLSDLERSAVDELLYMAVEDVTNLEAVLQLPWVQDDVSETEYEFLDFLGVLDTPNPANLLTALNMPWVQDGAVSAHLTNNMRWLARNFPALFLEIHTLPWVEDGLSDLERSAVDELLYMAVEDVTNLEAVLQLPWVQDDVSETEYELLDFLGVLDTPNPANLNAALNIPWVQDGGVSAYLTNNMRWLARNFPAVFFEIHTLPWVEDGLSDLERSAIDELLYMGADEIANLAALLRLSWVQDSISETELDIINWLGSLTYYDSQATNRLITMPFLESPDTTDVLALRGMTNLGWEGTLAVLTDHAIFQDGVTEQETTLIAAVGTLVDTDEIQRVLEPGVAAIETVQLGTNLTPGLKISIVRTDSQSRPGTIEATRDLVEFVEDTMGLPLPVDHVIIILSEGAVTDKYAGTNFGFAFSYLPKYEQQQGTFEWQRLQLGFVHEAAHYYWSGNEGWVDEGLANSIEYLFGRENGLSRGQLQPQRDYCEAHDLAMLSEWNPDSDEWRRYRCTYYLGQLLFQELLEDMGDEAFGGKLRELYRLTLQMQDDDRLPGIDAVRQVFSSQAEIVERHWSGKMNAPENRGFDEGLERTNHDLVEWGKYPTFDGGYVSFKGRLLEDAILNHGVGADALNKPQNFTLRRADRRESLGNILPPLPSGRTWNLSGSDSVVASTYILNQATREFNVTFQFAGYVEGDPGDYAVFVKGYQDNSRTPTIDDRIDVLAYARIRVESE